MSMTLITGQWFNTMDIDIDFKNRDNILDILTHIPASRYTSNKIVKHNVGIYFQNIPQDPVTGYSSIEYEEAEKLGYFKLDFINYSAYNNVTDLDHLDKLLNKEPIWELLEYKEIVQSLSQINSSWDIVSVMKPKNIDQLASTLALIRPAKRYLIGKEWDEIYQEIWLQPKDNNAAWFKKAHAYAYATVIIVELNLYAEKLLEEDKQ